MATNKRIYYAVYSVAFAECGTTSFTAAHGVQSVTSNVEFPLDPVFEVGQIDLYENPEQIPNISMTVEKVLDGYPLLYHLATKSATASSLAGRSNARATVGVSVFTDTNDSASGTPLTQVQNSGMYVSSLTYNFTSNGPFTEQVGLAGNNRFWGTFTAPTFNNLDEPLAVAGSGGANRRESFLLGESSASRSKFPLDIPGVSSSGYVPYSTTLQEHAVHTSSIRVSTNLGRNEIYELGKRGPYHRFATFPVEVKCDFEIIPTSGDMKAVDENSQSNTVQRTIVLRTTEGTVINLGTKNRLSSVNETGGNAGQQGGNKTVTYSYSNYNYLTITHPQDPAGLS